MSVSRSDVLAMAALAKLRLDDMEAECLRGDLNQILAHVDHLQGVEESAGEAGARHGGAPGPSSGTEDANGGPTRPADPDFLARRPDQMAPQWEDGHFVVPPPQGVDREGG